MKRALFAADIARIIGVSTRTARRMLKQVRETYGDRAVSVLPGKRGPRLYTTFAAWERVMPSLRQGGRDIFDRVAALEGAVLKMKSDMAASLTRA